MPFRVQLFWERLLEKNVHATIPKVNMGYGMINTLFLDTVAVEPTFVRLLYYSQTYICTIHGLSYHSS